MLAFLLNLILFQYWHYGIRQFLWIWININIYSVELHPVMTQIIATFNLQDTWLVNNFNWTEFCEIKTSGHVQITHCTKYPAQSCSVWHIPMSIKLLLFYSNFWHTRAAKLGHHPYKSFHLQNHVWF